MEIHLISIVYNREWWIHQRLQSLVLVLSHVLSKAKKHRYSFTTSLQGLCNSIIVSLVEANKGVKQVLEWNKSNVYLD